MSELHPNELRVSDSKQKTIIQCVAVNGKTAIWTADTASNLGIWMYERIKAHDKVINGENGEKYVGAVTEVNGKMLRNGQV